MPQNFTAADILASLLAFALFGLFAFVPGWVAAWSTDLLEFRKRGLPARCALAVPLSIGLSPVLAFLAGRFLSFSAIWFVFGLVWLLFPATCLLDFRRRRPGGFRWRYAAIGGAWIAIGLFSLADLQIGNRLYFSVVSYDYTLRTAIVASISRTGIPPASPFFFPGHNVPLRYHYFWLIPCSLVDLLGGTLVSARQAIIGGTLWCGLGLMAIAAAFLRFVHSAGPERIYRRATIGIALLGVTGLDLLPNLLLDSRHVPLADPEWWNEQVSAWITSVLWVPHHTASLIAGLCGVLIIFNCPRAASWRRIAWMVLAGFCLATCIGSSVYVSLVLGAALGVWIGASVLRRAWTDVLFAGAAGALSIVLIAPHLLALTTHTSDAAGAPPIAFAVRQFLPIAGLYAGSALRANLFSAAALPLNYFLELGVFLVAGVWTARRWLIARRKLDRYQLLTLALAGTSIFICTFFRSAVISNNDLGWRGFLCCQFVLLLWTVDLLEDQPLIRRPLVTLLIAIGAAGSVYEAATLRLFPVVFDALDIPRIQWLAADHSLGRRTYALRAGYEELKQKLPATMVVQHNPVAVPEDFAYGLYADRPVVDESGCAAVFGGDPADCPPIEAAITSLFAGTQPESEIDRTCTNLSIAAVLVKDTDPLWRNPASWVWRRRPIVANEFMRAVPCGSGGKLSAGLTPGAVSQPH